MSLVLAPKNRPKLYSGLESQFVLAFYLALLPLAVIVS